MKASSTILLGGILVAAAAGLRGAPDTITVNFHAAPGGPALLDTAGALVAAGAEVRVGWLDPSFDVASDGWNPVAVAAAFHEFGRTTVRPIFDEDGRFAAGVSGAGTASGGHAIALWIVTTSGAELAGPYSNVMAHALVTGGGANWVFPEPAALPPGNATVVSLAEADTVLLGAPAGGGTVENLQLASTGRSYSSWSATALAGATENTDPGDDADNDGTDNIGEFFAGTDPLVTNAPPAQIGVEVEGGQRWLVLTLMRSPWARGVDAEIQSSGDQIAWVPVADTSIGGDASASLMQTGRVPAPDTSAGERVYLRAVVRATQ